MVNALGGIKMYFPMPLYDAYSSAQHPHRRLPPPDGFQALAVVRARHLQYKPPGVKSQQPTRLAPGPRERPEPDPAATTSSCRVLATAVSGRGLSNPVTDNDLLGAVAPQLQVDSSFSLGDMLGTVLTFHGVNPTRRRSRPCRSSSTPKLPVQGYDYGSVELASQPRTSRSSTASWDSAPTATP